MDGSAVRVTELREAADSLDKRRIDNEAIKKETESKPTKSSKKEEEKEERDNKNNSRSIGQQLKIRILGTVIAMLISAMVGGIIFLGLGGPKKMMATLKQQEVMLAEMQDLKEEMDYHLNTPQYAVTRKDGSVVYMTSSEYTKYMSLPPGQRP